MDDTLRQRIADLLQGGADLAATSTIIQCRFSEVLEISDELAKEREQDKRIAISNRVAGIENGYTPAADVLDRRANKIRTDFVNKLERNSKHVKPDRKARLGPAHAPNVYRLVVPDDYFGFSDDE